MNDDKLFTIDWVELQRPPEPKKDLLLFLAFHITVGKFSFILRQFRLSWDDKKECFILKPSAVPIWVRGDKTYILTFDTSEEYWELLKEAILKKLEEEGWTKERLLKLGKIKLGK